MQFCPRCGRPLIFDEEIDDLFCICKCGNKVIIRKYLEASEIQEEKQLRGEGFVEDVLVNADFPHVCRKCNHDKAQAIDIGASVSDEANIILYKCAKCGYVERQADGTCNM
jgi:DNA-directed RNA polymerase subunit M/transcription elongation factor TFIIS